MKQLIIVILLSLPSFALMARGGIHTMHDFHPFRQYEFAKCLWEGSFPCRWAPDATLGYGQPLFNFYGQFSYWIGGAFNSFVLSVLDSVKATFTLSLIASGVGMFVLGRTYWGLKGGLLSAVLYTYAPYRAVDVWVRGALPESLAFVFFPLIWLATDRFLNTSEYKYLFYWILLTSGLLLTHNLSFLMFMPLVGVGIIFRLWKNFSKSKIEDLVSASLVVVLLSAFYLLPVVFESHLITLNAVVNDYFAYQSHYASLKQLLVSNFWGYGGSTWGPNDTMSFAVGYLQWMIPVAVSIWLLATRQFRKYLQWWILFVLGVSALFLTHGKSEFIWKLLPPLAYIQFPWRFLTLAVFFLSLSGGIVAKIAPKLVAGLIVITVLINFNFHRPDIWLSLTDSEYFSGELWDMQRSSAKSDYWPQTAPLPTQFAPSLPLFEIGSGKVDQLGRGAHRASYQLTVNSDYAKVVFPIVYFPGWSVNGEAIPADPSGLIVIRPRTGSHKIDLTFKDTFVRTLGNWVSVITLAGLVVWRYRYVKA